MGSTPGTAVGTGTGVAVGARVGLGVGVSSGAAVGSGAAVAAGAVVAAGAAVGAGAAVAAGAVVGAGAAVAAGAVVAAGAAVGAGVSVGCGAAVGRGASVGSPPPHAAITSSMTPSAVTNEKSLRWRLSMCASYEVRTLAKRPLILTKAGGGRGARRAHDSRRFSLLSMRVCAVRGRRNRPA